MDETKRSYALDAFPAAAVRFARALDRNRERIAEQEGVSASELRTMFFIGERVSVTPKQLSEHMHVTTSAVTFIIRRLVSIDMIQRVDHPGDRRSVLLELTPRAHTTMARIHAEFDEMIAQATASLDEEQLKVFTASLQQVGTAILQHVAQLATTDPERSFTL